MGRQGSREEVLVQEGLRVASKGQQKETSHLQFSDLIHFPEGETAYLLPAQLTHISSDYCLRTTPDTGDAVYVSGVGGTISKIKT